MLQVPCAYVRDGRLLLRGKRKQRTSGLWRAARIRNMLINSTYMGRHEYGKRSKVQRPTIVREVPAIVDEADVAEGAGGPEAELPVWDTRATGTSICCAGWRNADCAG